MLMHLLKKDFLIVRKYVLAMAAIVAAVPLILLWEAPELEEVVGFRFLTLFAVLMLMQYVCMKEYQYPRASSLLCAAPYPRSQIVLSKYLFCIIVYTASCLVYWVETLLVPSLGPLQADAVASNFLITAVVVAIYLPLEYRFGYEKTRILFILVIMAAPMLTAAAKKYGWMQSSAAVLPPMSGTGMVVLGAVVLWISELVSESIFRKADLA